MIRSFIISFIVLVTFSSCLKGEAECNYDPCGVKAPASEIQAVRDYLAARGITNAIEHCSGLFYVIDNAGSGKKPNACSGVTVHYKGQLTNGNVFDERDYGFYLTAVILGWRNGIPLIKSGGKIRLYVPPSLGYGNQSNGSIPANSILIFTVDLNSVE